VVGGGLAGWRRRPSRRGAGQRARAGTVAAPGGRARTRDQDGLFNVGPHALYRRGPGRASCATWRGLRGRGAAERGPGDPRLDAAYGLPVGPGSLLRTRLLPARASSRSPACWPPQRGLPIVARAPGGLAARHGPAAGREACCAPSCASRRRPRSRPHGRQGRWSRCAALTAASYIDGGWQSLADGPRCAAEAGAAIVADARAQDRTCGRPA
jgi:hypothetical protein